jgi:hypothetical protein
MRRVKCGEEKPKCLRCTNFGVVCDGYDTAFKGHAALTRSSVREIVPRGNNFVSLLAGSKVEIPFTTFFQDGTEYQYFLNYQEEAAMELSGPFDTRLWNRVVLQACHSEPSLCRLTTALGALHRAARMRRSTCHEDEACLHEKYALKEYGRALKGVQEMISNPHRLDATRLALIASLLIFCFESLHGDFDMAIKHMESALHLMNKQLLRASGRYKHLQNWSPIPDLEEDLVTEFVRLDSHLVSRTDNSKTRRMGSEIVMTSILNVNWDAEAYEVPHRFTTINEARRFLEYIQFRLLPKVAYEFGLQIRGHHHTISQYAKDLCKSHSVQFQKWRLAFAPLYAEACKSATQKDFVAAATLRVSGLSTEITAQWLTIRGTAATDLYEYESREIIHLSRLVMADPSFRRSFVFDCGFVPALFMVVVVCENIRLRKEALELLKQSMPRREGTWDSVHLVAAAEQFLQMREAAGEQELS